ncbi:MAG: acetyl-CoA acetyltransferase [Caulobacteraceae bacterium]|nr:acetyl-CoA acetyltransferase [Caulobacteraceae bacterium]
MSPLDLAARAARVACEDAVFRGAMAPHIDVVAAIRQFEVSGPKTIAPFGKADNFPRAVARRIGADPARAILEPVGGQGPQHLVNEFAHAIGAGDVGMALLCGAEAISTARRMAFLKQSPDWSEEVGGQLEDRGFGEPLLNSKLTRHGAWNPITVYALLENARRARLGLNRADYALEMGRLFAPFTKVAASNLHAASRQIHDAEHLATVGADNRLTADPYPRRMVARDQVNQGAALLMTSVDRARALGVPEARFVYLHGGADVSERAVIERADLSSSPASVMAVRRALDAAEIGLDAIDLFDLYSCFPIAVFNVRDGLGLDKDDPRPLTVTGGLPFFGGAGNNYSMHAIASMARMLRVRPGARGLVGANGGFLSKYSVGVYSTTPAAWRGFDSADLQREIDAWPAPRAASGEGIGRVETYTIDYSTKTPRGVVVGRLKGKGGRFVAMTDADDPSVVEAMIAHEPFGAKVKLALNAKGRSIIQSFKPKTN